MEGAGGSRRSAFRPVWVLLLCLILTITVIVGLFASRELADRVGFGVADSGVQNAQQVCDRLTPARLEEITGVAWSQGEANPRPGTLSDLASIDKACTVRGKPPRAPTGMRAVCLWSR